MKWHLQAVNITTNLKIKIDFTSLQVSATKVLTWNYHVDDFVKIRYDIILGRYILT